MEPDSSSIMGDDSDGNDEDNSEIVINYSSFFRDIYWLEKIPPHGLSSFNVITIRDDIDDGDDKGIESGDMAQLFKVIGEKLTNLAHVDASNCTLDSIPVPLPSIGHLLSIRADTLESFCGPAVGTPEELDMMLHQASGAAKLKDFAQLSQPIASAGFDDPLHCESSSEGVDFERPDVCV